MISGTAHRMRDAFQSAHNSAERFVHARTGCWGEPRFTIFGAEDQVVMEGEMRGRHTAAFSRSCRSAILSCVSPVVTLRFTTGYQLSSLRLGCSSAGYFSRSSGAPFSLRGATGGFAALHHRL